MVNAKSTQVRYGGWQSSLNGDYWLTVEDEGLRLFWVEAVSGGYIPWVISFIGEEAVKDYGKAIPLSQAIYECENLLFQWRNLAKWDSRLRRG